MSVILKRFNMPNCCGHCPGLVGGFPCDGEPEGDYEYDARTGRSMIGDFDVMSGRREGCTLVEMPEEAEYLRRMSECDKMGDPEKGHATADGILCDLLEKLGYTELVKAFDEVWKWYS